MKVIGVIPARYKSTRFPGKPLADICGKPMIWWVYKNVSKSNMLNNIYIATEDQRIYDVCTSFDIPVVMTSDSHPTGTDRVAEVAKKIPADIYVNIQGDEPLIEYQLIEKAITLLLSGKDRDIQVTNLMTEIKDPIDLINNTVPKVITNKDDIGIFLSRAATPYPKSSLSYKYYKQVCVYAFTPKALDAFSNLGRGKIEQIEDIEILRFIENGYKVQFVEVQSNTIAVDTQLDLKKVTQYIIDNQIDMGEL